MDKQTKKAASVFILILCSSLFHQLKAQETVPAAGSNASGTGGSVSYTIGQIEYTRISATGGSVSQGIQMPYEITVITSVSPSPGFSLKCTAYPNPAAGVLNLKVSNISSDNLTYELNDLNGKILETKKVSETETSINLSQYADAIYFLNVFDLDKKVESFRIVHN
jgi:hypothetical protein